MGLFISLQTELLVGPDDDHWLPVLEKDSVWEDQFTAFYLLSVREQMGHQPLEVHLGARAFLPVISVFGTDGEGFLQLLGHSIESIVVKLRLRLIEADVAEAREHPGGVVDFEHLFFRAYRSIL